MKIEGRNPVRGAPVQRKPAAKGAGGGGFAQSLGGAGDSETSGGAAVSSAGPLGSVDALLMIQEVDDALASRKKARARGEELLDRLDELRRFLLAGAIPRDRLEQLARLGHARRSAVDDPRLAEVLDEIDLRVQVELAKLSAGR